jgi:hypothetical protein
MTQALKIDELGTLPSGTSLQGYVTATRAEIEAVFGAPTITGEVNEKVTTEWVIRFVNGVVATIYDWKRYEQGAPEMDERIEWHIGGHDKLAYLQVGVELGKRAHSWR